MEEKPCHPPYQDRRHTMPYRTLRKMVEHQKILNFDRRPFKDHRP